MTQCYPIIGAILNIILVVGSTPKMNARMQNRCEGWMLRSVMVVKVHGHTHCAVKQPDSSE